MAVRLFPPSSSFIYKVQYMRISSVRPPRYSSDGLYFPSAKHMPSPQSAHLHTHPFAVSDGKDANAKGRSRACARYRVDDVRDLRPLSDVPISLLCALGHSLTGADRIPYPSPRGDDLRYKRTVTISRGFSKARSHGCHTLLSSPIHLPYFIFVRASQTHRLRAS